MSLRQFNTNCPTPISPPAMQRRQSKLDQDTMQDKRCYLVLRRLCSFCSASWSRIRHYPISSITILVLLFLLSSFFHSLVEFSSSQKANSLSLDTFSAAYVKALNESIVAGKPINFPEQQSYHTIPRIIHRTYKTTEIPKDWQGTYDSCRKVNPTYKQYFWTDEGAREFIQREFAWFLPTYDSYPYGIQRVDALRYFLLWHYGGIYIDMDIECRRPLDPLLDFPALLPKTWPYGVSNDFMASAPNHPFIIKVALSLQEHNHNYLSKYITVFFTTGPMFLSNILSQWLRMTRESSNDNLKLSHIVSILPSMMYDTTSYSFLGHRKGSSWHGNDVAVMRYTYQHIWGFLLGVVGLILLGGSMFCVQIKMGRRRYIQIRRGYEDV